MIWNRDRSRPETGEPTTTAPGAGTTATLEPPEEAPVRPGDPDRAAPAAGGLPSGEERRREEGLVASSAEPPRVALFEPEEAQRLRDRWTAVQSSFVDDPRDAVAHADALVQDTVRSLHEMFQRERRQFEALWTDGSQASTEDLRLAVQRYRSLFERLLEK